ncbi:hypothetical protein AB0M43_12415 [Longispora sp. NPDC051575]|uniref:hypothetical protein n=1 Tax=Longispora sp. NPDC051575 TaxID=3154943 RepID=UPI00343F9460
MLNDELIRSWKDPLSRVPGMEHPAGSISISDPLFPGGRASLLAGKSPNPQSREGDPHNSFTFSGCSDDCDSGDDDWWIW